MPPKPKKKCCSDKASLQALPAAHDARRHTSRGLHGQEAQAVKVDKSKKTNKTKTKIAA
ncbi:hypothetical protein [Aeromicrobium sp. UC242_57]|uniref:hypothetical protein n=1 Tax=Aeromicrobium sp. UC242_57 TaxID=3374624 RepID=UPI0037A2F232